MKAETMYESNQKSRQRRVTGNWFTNVIRWLAVLPVSWWVSGEISSRVQQAIESLNPNPSPEVSKGLVPSGFNLLGMPIELVQATVFAILSPTLLIALSSWIAPSRKFATATVVAVLYLIAVLFGMGLVITNVKVNAYLVLISTISIVLNLITTVLALKIVHLNHAQTQPTRRSAKATP